MNTAASDDDGDYGLDYECDSHQKVSRHMAILYLTKDLMFLSRVAGAGATRGVTVKSAGSAGELLQAAGEDRADLVIVDLSLPGIDLPPLVDALRALETGAPPIVAYAPHVHAERLDAARRAGCSSVLTRGQFDKQLERILDGLA